MKWTPVDALSKSIPISLNTNFIIFLGILITVIVAEKIQALKFCHKDYIMRIKKTAVEVSAPNTRLKV